MLPTKYFKAYKADEKGHTIFNEEVKSLMKCSNCGSAIKEDDVFCFNCGNKI